MLSLLSQICDIIGLILIATNGQILKNNLTIWSLFRFQSIFVALLKNFCFETFFEILQNFRVGFVCWLLCWISSYAGSLAAFVHMLASQQHLFICWLLSSIRSYAGSLAAFVHMLAPQQHSNICWLLSSILSYFSTRRELNFLRKFMLHLLQVCVKSFQKTLG